MSKPSVILGFSGGIDSSAAANLLLQAGYDVHTLTLLMLADDNLSRKLQSAFCKQRYLNVFQVIEGSFHLLLQIYELHGQMSNGIVFPINHTFFLISVFQIIAIHIRSVFQHEFLDLYLEHHVFC